MTQYATRRPKCELCHKPHPMRPPGAVGIYNDDVHGVIVCQLCQRDVRREAIRNHDDEIEAWAKDVLLSRAARLMGGR